MDPELAKKMIEALESGDAAAALAIIKEALAAAASGGAPPADDPPGDALADTPEPPPEEEQAAAAALTKLTGKASVGEAVAFLSDLVKRVDALDRERAALELSSRRELIARLVQLGVELPATAWDGKPEERRPCARLMAEPIDALRARVALLSKARPHAAVREPEGDASGYEALSRAEQAAADKIKDPEQRARFVELRVARKVRTNSNG